MKIVLANPATRVSVNEKFERFFIKAGSRWPWTTIKRKDEKNTNIFFPFYLAYAAEILRRDGNDVYVIDGVAMDMQDNEFLQRIKALSPQVLVVETTTHAINYDIALATKVKELVPEAKVVFTGPHATVYAGEILRENSVIDFIILGEYEFVLSELIQRLREGSRDLRIRGLAMRESSGVFVSKVRGFIEDINILPTPAFDIFPCNDSPDLSIYTDGICTYFPAVTLHSSRGCPFHCDFCLWNQVMYGNGKYRTFSPLRVVDEMELVVNKYGAREIYFDDDDFCVSKKHVLEICHEIKKRGLKIKWSCMGDAICTDEEMIKAMADAGCIFMKFGVESGNMEILRRIGKPLKPDKAVEISKLCRRYGIMTHATFSFGLDGETRESMEETLRLANRIKFDYAQVSITTPYPGTRFFEKLVKKGALKNLSWDNFDGTSCCVFETDTIKAEEVEMFRKKAIKSMLLHKIVDPIWVKRYLRRSLILMRQRGLKPVLAPLRAAYYTFFY